MSTPELFQRLTNVDKEVEDIAKDLQIESMVLFKILCNYKPSIVDEIEIVESSTEDR